MFKNATLLRLKPGAAPAPLAIALSAEGCRHVPIGATESKSIGWVPPREKHGRLLEVVGGQWIMAAMIETRTVPPAAVEKLVEEHAAMVERDTGRKPGRKQRRELKDAAVLELLPRAFPKATRVLVWIDPDTGIIVTDTASVSVADDVASLLVALDIGTIEPVSTKLPPSTVMTRWLMDGQPDIEEFELCAACELRADDETEAVVRYTNFELDCSEVKRHAISGKRCTSLALGWQGKAWFTLTDGPVLKGLEIMGDAEAGTSHADEFDANVAIFTGGMRQLLPDLIAALDGFTEEEAATS